MDDVFYDESEPPKNLKHRDMAGRLYDPRDYLNEHVRLRIEGDTYWFDIYCPKCGEKMWESNEPCRLLPLSPCHKCGEKP